MRVQGMHVKRELIVFRDEFANLCYCATVSLTVQYFH